MKIIAFVDGSSYSATVCDYAAWAAKRLSSSIEVYHVLGRRDRNSAPADLSGSLNLGERSALLSDLARADEERSRLAQARGRMILDETSKRITAAGIKSVETRLRSDDIVTTVGELEGEAELIVLGKRGEASGFAKEHLGSNLERILRSAKKPVFIATGEFVKIERYIIAYDGSASVLKAIDYIAASKLFKGLSCHLLQVGDESVEARSKIEGAAALLQNGGQKVTVEFHQGEPAKVIPSKIEEYNSQLLVMGAYGHSRIRALIIGSTTTEMVRTSDVPVLMFR